MSGCDALGRATAGHVPHGNLGPGCRRANADDEFVFWLRVVIGVQDPPDHGYDPTVALRSLWIPEEGLPGGGMMTRAGGGR